MHVWVYMRVYIWACVYMQSVCVWCVSMHVLVCGCEHACRYLCDHVRKCACMSMYVSMYVYNYVCVSVHVCVCVCHSSKKPSLQVVQKLYTQLYTSWYSCSWTTTMGLHLLNSSSTSNVQACKLGFLELCVRACVRACVRVCDYLGVPRSSFCNTFFRGLPWQYNKEMLILGTSNSLSCLLLKWHKSVLVFHLPIRINT